MFTTSILLALATITTLITAQDLTFDSAAFNGSSNNVIVFSAPSQIEVTSIDEGPPTIIVNTWNVTSTFLAVMSYNYTARNPTTHQNESLTRWLWVQPDMTIAWAAEYPADQEATGATLIPPSSSSSSGSSSSSSTAKPPAVAYSPPHIDASTSIPLNLTIQIFQQTEALRTYLSQSTLDPHSPSSLRTYLEKLSRFMVYDSSTTSNAQLMDTPRAATFFQAVNTKAGTGTTASSSAAGGSGNGNQVSLPDAPLMLDLKDPVTSLNGSVTAVGTGAGMKSGATSSSSSLSLVTGSMLLLAAIVGGGF